MKTKRGVLFIAGALLALGGCGKGGGSGDSAASSSGGGGLMHEISREMNDPKRATRSGVEILTFFDVSDSSTDLRQPLSKLLEQVIDTNDEAVPLTYSFFGKNCDEQNTSLTSLTGVRRAGKDWIASKLHDNTTNLSTVFKHIETCCKQDPGTQYGAVIVTDGGFEDPDAARGSIRHLQSLSNLKYLAFVGIHTGDNPKLQKLRELTQIIKGTPGDPGGIAIELVTDRNNDASIAEAQSALMRLVSSSRKSN